MVDEALIACLKEKLTAKIAKNPKTEENRTEASSSALSAFSAVEKKLRHLFAYARNRQLHGGRSSHCLPEGKINRKDRKEPKDGGKPNLGIFLCALVVELHGTNLEVECQSCRRRSDPEPHFRVKIVCKPLQFGPASQRQWFERELDGQFRIAVFLVSGAFRRCFPAVRQ
jgi:hypothetical protein